MKQPQVDEIDGLLLNIMQDDFRLWSVHFTDGGADGRLGAGGD